MQYSRTVKPLVLSDADCESVFFHGTKRGGLPGEHESGQGLAHPRVGGCGGRTVDGPRLGYRSRPKGPQSHPFRRDIDHRGCSYPGRLVCRASGGSCCGTGRGIDGEVGPPANPIRSYSRGASRALPNRSCHRPSSLSAIGPDDRILNCGASPGAPSHSPVAQR